MCTPDDLNELGKYPSVQLALQLAGKFPPFKLSGGFLPWYSIALVKTVKEKLTTKEQERVYTLLRLKGYNITEIQRHIS